jgi:hypothetical protein
MWGFKNILVLLRLKMVHDQAPIPILVFMSLGLSNSSSLPSSKLVIGEKVDINPKKASSLQSVDATHTLRSYSSLLVWWTKVEKLDSLYMPKMVELCFNVGLRYFDLFNILNPLKGSIQTHNIIQPMPSV